MWSVLAQLQRGQGFFNLGCTLEASGAWRGHRPPLRYDVPELMIMLGTCWACVTPVSDLVAAKTRDAGGVGQRCQQRVSIELGGNPLCRVHGYVHMPGLLQALDPCTSAEKA